MTPLPGRESARHRDRIADHFAERDRAKLRDLGVGLAVEVRTRRTPPSRSPA